MLDLSVIQIPTVLLSAIKNAYNFQEAVEFCKSHGVPVMFKAAYGGGGRGMRMVFKMEEVAEQFERAR